MAPFDFLHWLIPIIVVALLIANRDKIDRFVVDLADGIRMFKARIDDPNDPRAIANFSSIVVLVAVFLTIIAWGLASIGGGVPLTKAS